MLLLETGAALELESPPDLLFLAVTVAVSAYLQMNPGLANLMQRLANGG